MFRFLYPAFATQSSIASADLMDKLGEDNQNLEVAQKIWSIPTTPWSFPCAPIEDGVG